MRFKSGATGQTLGGKCFRLVGSIDTKPGPNGLPKECTPPNPKRLPLNSHGHGPFCRLVPPPLPATSGVYAVTVNRCLVYVGCTNNLRRQWGQGFAKISLANRRKGGQSTNCKVNRRILLDAKDDCEVELWIHETSNHQYLKERLLDELCRSRRSPPWNE